MSVKFERSAYGCCCGIGASVAKLCMHAAELCLHCNAVLTASDLGFQRTRTL